MQTMKYQKRNVNKISFKITPPKKKKNKNKTPRNKPDEGGKGLIY